MRYHVFAPLSLRTSPVHPQPRAYARAQPLRLLSPETQTQQGALLPGPWPQLALAGKPLAFPSSSSLQKRKSSLPSFVRQKDQCKKSSSTAVSCLAPSHRQHQDDAFGELGRRSAVPLSQTPPRKEAPSSASAWRPLRPTDSALRNS